VIFSNPTKEGAITHWVVSSEKLTVVLMRRQLSRLFYEHARNNCAMTDAKTLSLKVLAIKPDCEKVASFLAKDGVVEPPSYGENQ
jgi:hypothetical protein